ncbi:MULTISPECIES: response regulator transcription factor [unclassified Romboutsia]|uniref:response regulator transcription factor n=1 Tax=unclassified Romboutsia TaxID=2626894 RepID=UPI000821B1BC|nr:MULTISPECIES: response regulator transcription factor [unclassified Romboutsia]SCH16096.1 Response regulator protein vraR [uncultured Clostridium sp.]
MSKINVLIVDDEKLIRTGLKIILKSYDDINVIGDVANGYEALDFCKNNSVDLVLMDIRMNICDGVLGTRLIKEYDESIKILILTTFNDDKYIKDAMNLGASGYLLKDSSNDVIYEGIRSSFYGNIVLDKSVASKVINNETNNTNEIINTHNLSSKEIDIIKLIANGLTNKEISNELFLSEGTIKNNISNILSKLNLRDRTQIAIFAFKNKIVT